MAIFFSHPSNRAAEYFYTIWPWVATSSWFLIILVLIFYYSRFVYLSTIKVSPLIPMPPGGENFRMREVSYVYDIIVNPELEIRPADIEVLSVIDQGFFGSVYLAKRIADETLVVLKARVFRFDHFR